MALKDILRKSRRSVHGALAAMTLVTGAFSASAKDTEGQDRAFEMKQNAQMPSLQNLKRTLAAIDKLAVSGAKSALIEREGNVPYLYLDRGGILHTGVGVNVNDFESFSKLEFKDGQGRLLSLKQKKAFYAQIKAFQNKQAKRGFNFRASYYANKFAYRPTEESRNRLFDARVQNSLETVKEMLGTKAFYDLHVGAVREMITMHYNLGSNRFNAQKFPNFFTAAKRCDYATMAKESHIKGIAEARNRQVYKAIAACSNANWKPFGTMYAQQSSRQLYAYNQIAMRK